MSYADCLQNQIRGDWFQLQLLDKADLESEFDQSFSKYMWTRLVVALNTTKTGNEYVFFDKDNVLKVADYTNHEPLERAQSNLEYAESILAPKLMLFEQLMAGEDITDSDAYQLYVENKGIRAANAKHPMNAEELRTDLHILELSRNYTQLAAKHLTEKYMDIAQSYNCGLLRKELNLLNLDANTTCHYAVANHTEHMRKVFSEPSLEEFKQVLMKDITYWQGLVKIRRGQVTREYTYIYKARKEVRKLHQIIPCPYKLDMTPTKVLKAARRTVRSADKPDICVD